MKKVSVAALLVASGSAIALGLYIFTANRGYTQIAKVSSSSYDSSLPQWAEWNRRQKLDKKWEWKTLISFDGLVVDQDRKPVDGAKVTLSWNDLSFEGTSVRELTTDREGRFSLTGVRGKMLLLRSITKNGYKSSSTNRDVFEYSAFFDENYYIPDPKKPVILRLHRDAPTGSTIIFSEKYRVPESGILSINLKTGQVGGDDFRIDFVDNSDPTGKHWMARVSAPSGGIQSTNEEFTEVVPETGYVSEVSVNQDSPPPLGSWSGSLYKGGRFYVKSYSGDAVVEFWMVPGNSSIHFKSALTPTRITPP